MRLTEISGRDDKRHDAVRPLVPLVDDSVVAARVGASSQSQLLYQTKSRLLESGSE